jgi:putative hemolysin
MDRIRPWARTNSIAGMLFLLLITGLVVVPAGAMLNPATVYCKAMGYNWTVRYVTAGEEGLCILPDGRAVNEWDFLQGFAGKEYGYCTKQGYQSKTIQDSRKCNSIIIEVCSVCILKNGTEVQVTDLMNLSFEETLCGDGSCGLPETYKTCPQDCKSGTWDGYCDGKFDGKCDRDCTVWQDPDCFMKSPYFIAGVIVIIAGLIVWYFLQKRKKGHVAK